MSSALTGAERLRPLKSKPPFRFLDFVVHGLERYIPGRPRSWRTDCPAVFNGVGDLVDPAACVDAEFLRMKIEFCFTESARDGFALSTAIASEAHQREKLERACRQASSPHCHRYWFRRPSRQACCLVQQAWKRVCVFR
jgi:hypothetical protein